MTDIEFLTLVQQQTDTKAVVVDEYYKSAFMDWAILDHNAPKHIISRKFDELIDEFIRIEMPTPYESMVHYPFVKDFLMSFVLHARKLVCLMILFKNH